jgi:hypothetical protein
MVLYSMKTTTKVSDAKLARRKQKLWIELEWRRCVNDKKYFMNNYVYIQVQPKWDQRGRTLFSLFDYQEEALNTWNDNRYTVIVKARQLGYTTLAMADILWHSLFQPGSNLLLVSKNQDSANKNLGMVKFMYQFLPDWMKERGPKLEKAAEYKLEFEFADGMKCQVKSFAGTETAGAGETATMVVLDEFALMPDPTNTYRTIMPTTDAGGKILIISTARGAYNEFAKIYKNAKNKTNQFIPIFQPWSASKLITLKEYEIKRREFSANPWEFYSEYPSNDIEAFRESGNPRFINLPDDADEMQYRGYLKENENGIDFIIDDEGQLYINEYPDYNLNYYIGADPAQGKGGDYSTAHVMTVDENNIPRIVAFYRSNTIEPVDWAIDMDMLGRFYSGKSSGALLAIEDQGGQGQLPINELHRNLNYPNPYLYRPTGKKGYKYSDRLFSFPMTADKRKMIIDKLADYLSNANTTTPSLQGIHKDLLEELNQFVRQELPSGGVRYAADYGCHDDLVMSLAITLWILTENQDISAPVILDDRNTIKVEFRKMREIRERNIAEAEKLQQEAWESFSLGGGLYYD